MSTARKYRYPGINSFETTDTDIFFGREDDRQSLADRVEIEKNLLLYSRSGLGKSSLLKAGLIPELAKRGYQSFYVRLGLYQEGSLPPVQNTLRRSVLANQTTVPLNFLQKFLARKSSLWQAFKSYQLSGGDDRPIVLIFDQFEEFASYPARYIHEFKQQLAELLYTPLPKEFGEALKDDTLLTEPVTDAELELLYKPMRVRVVFSIRSDQLNIINSLSDYLPNILKTFYELKPLSEKQARNAIIKPAAQPGAFTTPAFVYQPSALEKLIGSLASKKADEIDTAQLQILLQYVEKDIVEGKKDIDITADDLGELNKVYEDYYLNSLRKLVTEQQPAQVLIEDKLIADGRRVSYDSALCLQVVSAGTLEALIETRLLRREPNTLGGYSYEVSHDSLVAPILKTRDERKLNEEKAALAAQLENELKKQRQRRKAMALMVAALLVCVGLAAYALVARSQFKAAASRAERSDSVTKIALADARRSDSISRRSDSLTKIALAGARRADSITNVSLVGARKSDSAARVALRKSKISEGKAEAEKRKVQAEQARTEAALAHARRQQKQRLEMELRELKADERVYIKSGDTALVIENQRKQQILGGQIGILETGVKP